MDSWVYIALFVLVTLISVWCVWRGRWQLAVEKRKLNEQLEVDKQRLQRVRQEQEEEWESVQAMWASKKMRMEAELRERKESLDRRESALQRVESEIDQRWEHWDEQRRELTKEEEKLKRVLREYTDQLEKLSGKSSEEAYNELKQKVENVHREELIQYRKLLFDTDHKVLEEKARRVLIDVIQRISGNLHSHLIYTVITLPEEGYKGMIIGRDGRNCKAFEMKTGVTLIVDDASCSVTLSGFDPVAREVAKIALESLILKGKITPSLIEEEVDDAKGKLEEWALNTGEEALKGMGVEGPVHSEIKRALGKLKLHRSCGQNTLSHSIEVGQICGMIADEIGLDRGLAKRAGLFHDIGKSIKENSCSSHAIAGAQLLKIHNEDDVVVNVAESHHNQTERKSIYAYIVQIADQISASRTGARASTMESLIERVRGVEKLAKAFKGVQEAYAFQGGRELWVIVNPEKIEDWEVGKLTAEIKKAIEEDPSIHEQVKITVVREVRVTETVG